MPFEDPRKVLQRHGLGAKRSYSQNFLCDPNAVRQIVQAVESLGPNPVVELGPGLGTLTGALCELGRPIVAIERDPRMLEVLALELPLPQLRVRLGDAAKVDYGAISDELAAAPIIAGNLPYAITGAILRGLSQARAQVAGAVLMVQREVRDRLVARENTRAYGALTVFVQNGFEVETVTHVKAGSFHPRPKVDSSVVQLRPRAAPISHEEPCFRRIVRAAFQARRKTLRRALASLAPPEPLARALGEAGIDPQRRGETLSIGELASLARALEPHTERQGRSS